MKYPLYFCIINVFFIANPLQAYELLEARSEITPGCEGGIVSRVTTSWIMTSKVNDVTSSDDFMDDLGTDPHDP